MCRTTVDARQFPQLGPEDVGPGTPTVSDGAVGPGSDPRLRGHRVSDVEWAGAVPLPTPGTLPDGERVRVRLTEHEPHEADPFHFLAQGPGRTTRGRRLVYADSVDLA